MNEIEKLKAELKERQKKVSETQKKIDLLNAKKNEAKAKLFDILFNEFDNEKLRDSIRLCYKKLSKAEQKQLANIYDWIATPQQQNPQQQNPQINSHHHP